MRPRGIAFGVALAAGLVAGPVAGFQYVTVFILSRAFDSGLNAWDKVLLAGGLAAVVGGLAVLMLRVLRRRLAPSLAVIAALVGLGVTVAGVSFMIAHARDWIIFAPTPLFGIALLVVSWDTLFPDRKVR